MSFAQILRLRSARALALVAAAAAAAGAQTTAFVGVNVIPMDRDRVVENQTVVVRDGRIVSVGPSAQAAIPTDATRIDGRGKFLLPGLAEMHAHVPPQQATERVTRDIMFLYIANGVTTIRGMLGAPYQLQLRSRLASGEILGPTLYVGAPSINGNTAPDPATGARLVREHKAAGYDLLKIHPGPSRATYDSVAAVAAQVGISLGGHVPNDVGIDRALEVRQATIDHLDGYLIGAVNDAMKARIASPTDTVRPGEIWRAVQPERMRALARRTKELGVWNVPTMYLWENFNSPTPGEELAKKEEMKYAPKQWVTGWVNQKRNRDNAVAQMGLSAEDAALEVRLRRQMLKMLADEGAPLLMGTDSPQMFNVPGFALHRELQVAVASGLTAYQVLESGSKNVARYAREVLKVDGNFGTVTEGARADLVLLDANPLQDLGNLTKRAGVMVRGKWVTGEEISRGLAELAARMAQ
jgi:imidazolonepropionase-like amidohydrolase